jgi:YD repeat-containing protein
VRGARLAALIASLLLVPAAFAQQHPNQRKGFDPASVYHLDGLDDVNLFNGNLVVTIPIGQTYTIDGGLSYGLTAVYNGNIWDRGVDTSRLLTYPHRRGNAGLGWVVSLGRLLWADDPTNTTVRLSAPEVKAFVYEAADGSDHEFAPDAQLDTNTYITTVDRVTGGDGALYRMSTSGAFKRIIELPDGRKQTFEYKNHDKLDEIQDWRLTEIADRFGNVITVSYPGNDRNTWVITDGYRTQTLYFRAVAPEVTTFPQTVLDRVELAAFGNTTATYRFEYTNATIQRPPNDQSGPQRDRGPDIQVQTLSAIVLASTERYEMAYETGGYSTGLLKTLTLPTLGRIEYTWSPVYFSQASARIGPLTMAEPNLGQIPLTGSPFDPEDGLPAPMPDAPQAEAQTLLIGRFQSVGITSRTFYMRDETSSPYVPGQPSGALRRWIYEHKLSSRPTCNTSDGMRVGDPRQKMTIVTSPEGSTSVHYFSVYREGTVCEAPEGGPWKGIEYGRPVTHYNSVGLTTDLYGVKGLSSETFVGAVTRHVATAPNWRPVAGTLARSTWVTYHDIAKEKTEAAVRRTAEDDTSCGGACFTEEYRLNWDDFGHFRQTSTGGNYPADQKYRTTFTNYSGKGPNDPWVLNTWTEQCVRDETTLRKEAVTGCSALMSGATAANGAFAQFCFDHTNGFLKARRTLTGATPGASDVVTVFTPSTNGNVASERTYGGDTQSLAGVSDLCTLSGLPTPPVYQTDYEYTSGAVKKATPVIAASHWDESKRNTPPFDTVNNEIDPSTGLVAASTDPSGVRTELLYDSSGRLTEAGVVDAPSHYVAAHASYVYTPASGSTPASVASRQVANGSDLTEETYSFDGLGRLTRETRRMPAGTAVRATTYDIAGRKETVMDFGSDPTHVTTYGYDALGRVLTVTVPDGAVTAYEYSGVRETRRKTKVKTPDSAVEADAWSREESDSLGRLAHVSGPTLVNPALTADYGYDVGDRLISVQMKRAGDSSPVQRRTFSYDGRGFLAYEEHPESNRTDYRRYDARGHAEEKRQGSLKSTYDLNMQFDAAERLVAVQERTAAGQDAFRPLKVFTFSGANGFDAQLNKINRTKGKLETAVRYNYDGGALGGDRTVTTTYAYAEDQGRISSKSTAVQSGPTFKQDFTYDALGLPTHLRFPTCTGCGTVERDARPLALGWSNGYLQSVGTFVNGITYHGNGMIRELTHATSRHGQDALTDVMELDRGMPRPASITVKGLCTGPQISAGLPANAVVFPGGSATLTAPSEGDHVEWFNATTGASLGLTTRTITTPAIFENTGFRVRVFGADGCFTDSAVATVTVLQCSDLQIVSLGVPPLVAKGSAASLSVAVSAPSNVTLSYKWRLITEGPDGPVETFAVTSIPQYAPVIGANTRVQVIVSSGSQCARSSEIRMVRICEPPAIVVGPHSQWAAPPPAGESVPFSATVVASGENLRYQWYERIDATTATALAGETDDTLSRSYSAIGTHTFFVRVTDDTSPTGCTGSVDSEDIVFSVTSCARLTMEPANLWLYEGTPPMSLPVEVTTAAGMTGTIKFTWYSGSGSGHVAREQTVPIPSAGGATRDNLTIFSNNPTQIFWCRVDVDVSGGAGCDVTLTTRKGVIVRWGSCPLPPISVTPKSALVNLNGSPAFTVACDWPRVTYQWYYGESGDTHRPISGATSNKYRADSTVRSYWCRVTDECGLKHLDTETVTVSRNGNPICSPPFIGEQPKSVDVAAGVTPTLRIDATNASSLQWWEVGGGMVGSGPEFLAPSLTKTYVVKLLSACNTGAEAMESALVTVRVASCPTITITQPASLQSVNGSRQLTVGATSASPITFTWYEGLPGDVSHPVGMGATLPVSPAATTNYWVRISTSQCTVDSAPVAAAACGIPSITRPPVGGSITAGELFLLDGAAGGVGISYKWHSGSQTGPVVGTSPGVWVAPTDTTTYVLEAVDTCGTSVFANPITVLSCVTPAFNAAPAVSGLDHVFTGKTAGITARATEGRNLPLEYRLCDTHGAPIGNPVPAPANGGAVTLTTPPITAETQFIVRATAGACSIDSAPVTVYLCTQAEIAGMASDQQVAVNESVHLRTGPNDATDPDNAYAWYPGESGTATGPAMKSSNENWITFTAQNPTNGNPVTKYWAEIVNRDGCKSRTPTYIVRVCKPTITGQPVGNMVDPDQGWTLSVAADTPGLTYQWYVGATGVTTTPAQNGQGPSLLVYPTVDTSYWVRVTGACGTTVDSNAALVTVCQRPAISAVGASVTSIARGDAVNLAVNATGTNLTYQWYIGAPGVTTSPVPGGATATVANLAPQDTTTYWARVSGRCGSADSQAVTITVCATPRIDTQPQDKTIFSGSTATLSVAATALTAVPISYQWYVGTAPDTNGLIGGATAPSYTTPTLTSPQNYWVRVKSGNCTAADSVTAAVSLCPYPISIAAPADAQTSVGQTTRLTTVPQAGSNVYRWYQVVPGGPPLLIAGPSSNHYVDVAPTVTTQYFATISTGGCVTTTGNATVNVCVPTFTLQPPASLSVIAGVQTDLDVQADTAGVTYQWYRGTGANAVLLTGETNKKLRFTTSTNTSYWCRATGYCGRTTDSTVTNVTVCTRPTISAHPVDATPMNAGGTRTLSVTAGGTGLTYQWYAGDSGNTSQPVGGATTSTLTRTLTQTEKYWVRVTGTCGTLDSGAAWISVIPPITTNLSNMLVRSGSSAPFKVVATGSYLHYKWYLDNVAVTGNDAPYYTIPSVTTATSVFCDVSSGTGVTRSSGASVGLCDGQSVSIGVSGTGSCRTLTAYYSDYGPETYAWYKGNPGDISNPVGNTSSISVCPTGSTKYWLRTSMTLFTGETCYSDAAAVTVP